MIMDYFHYKLYSNYILAYYSSHILQKLHRAFLVIYYLPQIKLYTYNWSHDLVSKLEKQLTRITYWHRARCKVLTSIVCQKMGLYLHSKLVQDPHPPEPPTSHTEKETDDNSKKDLDANPYLSSSSNVDMLIKHLSPPMRDSLTRAPHTSVRSGSLRTILPRYDFI